MKRGLPLAGAPGPAGAAASGNNPAPPVRRWARAALVGPRLEELLLRTDAAARTRGDPVELPHRYTDPLDIELSALLSAALAYGRVDLFKPRLVQLHEWLGPRPSVTARARSVAELQTLVERFSYRMTGPAEVAALLAGAAALQERHGSMGAAFAKWFNESGEPTVRGALGRLVDALVDGAPGGPTRRLKHLLPHPERGSACKRPNLFLRWMVRGPDAVDFGLWRGVPPSALVMPLDTHVQRISGLIGLTRRTDLSWATAEEITARLRALDPADPVRFDFAISHLGISGSCKVRRDERACAGCPLRPVCRVW